MLVTPGSAGSLADLLPVLEDGISFFPPVPSYRAEQLRLFGDVPSCSEGDLSNNKRYDLGRKHLEDQRFHGGGDLISNTSDGCPPSHSVETAMKDEQ